MRLGWSIVSKFATCLMRILRSWLPTRLPVYRACLLKFQKLVKSTRTVFREYIGKKHVYTHVRRKDFSRGGATRVFSKIFLGGPKVVKFVFSYSKLRKQPFLLKFSKSKGGQGHPLPPFRRPCVRWVYFIWLAEHVAIAKIFCCAKLVVMLFNLQCIEF